VIHLVVLAAGRGRRLGALGDAAPKWLLEVDGRTLAERQLEAVELAERQSPGSVASVSVVTGHATAAIERFVAERDGLQVALVENPLYDKLNNWYSLLLALRRIPVGDGASRIVVFNGDLFARPEWFAHFLTDSAATPGETLIAVDTARALTEESMKVSATEAGKDGMLLDRIAKVDVEHPIGEYVGMFMVRGEAHRRLGAMLESFEGSEETAQHWYEEAIGRTARAGVPWVVWPTPDSEWVEIDDEADYEAARRLGRTP
jgi:choline kinase